MPAYACFISDVHKSYLVEKIVLHYLADMLSSLVRMAGQTLTCAFSLLKFYIVSMGSTKSIPGNEASIYADILISNFFVIQIIVKSLHHINL